MKPIPDDLEVDVHLTVQATEVDDGDPGALTLETYSVVMGAAHRLNGSRIFGIDARKGHFVRFFAESGSSNFEQAVLLTKIEHVDGDENLVDFELVERERVTVVPNSSFESVLPPDLVTLDFWFTRCRVAGRGAGLYRLCFSVYDRDENGQPQPMGMASQQVLILTILPPKHS